MLRKINKPQDSTTHSWMINISQENIVGRERERKNKKSQTKHAYIKMAHNIARRSNIVSSKANNMYTREIGN